MTGTDATVPGGRHRAVVYADCNTRHGHLRVDVGDDTYLFLNTSDLGVDFGLFEHPKGVLGADALRSIAEYCTRMADSLEDRSRKR
jgi:hypothetical protein